MFEGVVDEYDAGRPEHPDGVYDRLGDVRGHDVFDVGAGTGIATRALIARGANVVAVDSGAAVLGRAAARTPGLRAAVGDGARLPFRSRCADLLCFAQAWHWLDAETRSAEAHRVLRPGGRLAMWWSHARADGERWFDESWALIEQACAGTHRAQRDTDWAATLDASLFDVSALVSIPWMRATTVDGWLTDQASHSYVAALGVADRDRLIAALGDVVTAAFPDGAVQVRYETWMWQATSR